MTRRSPDDVNSGLLVAAGFMFSLSLSGIFCVSGGDASASVTTPATHARLAKGGPEKSSTPFRPGEPVALWSGPAELPKPEERRFRPGDRPQSRGKVGLGR